MFLLVVLYYGEYDLLIFYWKFPHKIQSSNKNEYIKELLITFYTRRSQVSVSIIWCEVLTLIGYHQDTQSFWLPTYLLCLVDMFSAVGIPMGTSCALLLVDLLIFSHETDSGFSRKMKSFKFKFWYKDDVLSFNNSEFGDFVHHIYSIELEIKDTTDRARSASYLDLHLEIDNVLRMNLYDESNHCNFPIMNLLFICGNIPEAPAYGVYISQLFRYFRPYGSYHDFLDRALATNKEATEPRVPSG